MKTISLEEAERLVEADKDLWQFPGIHEALHDHRASQFDSLVAIVKEVASEYPSCGCSFDDCIHERASKAFTKSQKMEIS
ncbi:MAG: hypothetical protein M0R32_09215 [Candidatus Cloacimonetes bacterium]|jgi:hypothetical protein|nr:hypothetical protein [Candidatus Cloacimonadota bacterium]